TLALKPARLRPTAKRDVREAVAWYQERDRDLAARFLDAIYTTIALLERFPNLGTSVYGIGDPNVRQLPVDRFPYQVVFRREKHALVVVAIAHERKRPGYWNE
ncbi:MAG TPA: type II toxin-antitoxin system RelE/ParE family toxin, partial [Thermoanaerobaculia bacterium]